RRRRRQQAAAAPAPAPSPVPDPVAEASSRELGEKLEAALRSIDRDDSALLRLHLFDELTCREIGERLGRRAGTVRTQVSRALAELRRHLPVSASALAALLPDQAPVLAALRQRVLRAGQQVAPGPAVATANAAVAARARRARLFATIAGAAIL